MKTTIEIVKELKSKYGLTDKDLFSFCICAVNFLEYYEEESMCDVMRACPERYFGADSNNTKAAAGALSAEKKSMEWTDEDQFAHYMEYVQNTIARELEDGELDYFLDEYQRFGKVYKREIMVPIMIGCPVEDYDDSKFYDEEYIESITNADNLLLYKANKEEEQAKLKKYMEEQADALAKEVENRKDDKEFTVLLAASFDISEYESMYKEYNEKLYPGKDYKVITLKNPQTMIIQTGGKTIEEVKDRVLKLIRSRVMLLGHTTKEMLIPIEKAFDSIPKVLTDNNVTYVVTYF